jgi:hypothetical protein
MWACMNAVCRLNEPVLAAAAQNGPEELVKVRIALALMLALTFSIAAASPARTQTKDQKRAEAQLRTVHGSVLDKAENPVPSSVVYLKNLKTQAVKTYIADDTAHYRFSGLDPNVDYEIHAEHADATSPTRTISSYDTRRDIELTLKLTRKRPVS